MPKPKLILKYIFSIGIITDCVPGDAVWDESREMYISSDGTFTPFQSIPDGFYWSIITMCTVGYGDNIPSTQVGKLVAVVAALTGILLLAIPIRFPHYRIPYFPPLARHLCIGRSC